MKPIIIQYSSDRYDQDRLTKVGGSIAFRKGKPVFEFRTFDQYQQYLSLQRSVNA